MPEWPTDGLVTWQPPLGSGPALSNNTLLGFSAVCWIMGATLYTEYLDATVPIGLIHSSHGGSSIQVMLILMRATLFIVHSDLQAVDFSPILLYTYFLCFIGMAIICISQ